MKFKLNSDGKIVLVCLFALAFLLWFGFNSQSFGADKSAYNLYGHSTPDWSETTSVWFTFWDEHIDWQTSGKTWYYPHATRGQPVGTYELAQAWSITRLPWLYTFYDSNSVHRDSGLVHVKVNSYYYPRNEVVGTSRLLPGWDPANDVGGNWVRDWKADYDYNNASTYFTVTYSPDYVEDAGGGQMGTWTANEWQRDVVIMGWGGNTDTVWFRVDSNTTTRLYLNGDIPSHTYNWFIVDDSSAVNHNAVAMTDSLARIRPQAWTYNLINIKHWLAKAFAGRFFHNMIHTDLLGREPTDIYPDDILKTNVSYSCGSGWCDNWTMGGTCLEGLDDDDIYRPAVREYLRQIKDSLGSGNFLLVNVYEVNVGWDSIVYNHSVSGLWHEFWLNGNEDAGTWSTKWGTIRKYMQSPYNYNLHFFQASPGSTNGDADRFMMNDYSQYLLMYGDSMYLLYGCSYSYGSELADTTNWWRGIMSKSIGTPSDTAISTTVSGATIWKRFFSISNGIVVWKPKPSSGSNYTDVTSGIPLDSGYYYQLTVDGDSTGDSTNSISLMNAQSFIGIKTSGGTPPKGTRCLFTK